MDSHNLKNVPLKALKIKMFQNPRKRKDKFATKKLLFDISKEKVHIKQQLKVKIEDCCQAP